MQTAGQFAGNRAPPIIPAVARRIHVEPVQSGTITLTRSQSHHVRDVLRMNCGDELELFDGTGQVAVGVIHRCDESAVEVRVDRIQQFTPAHDITIASAIPKGDRADWMVEKLSELGVSRFVPLLTDRSVVEPKGRAKLERWKRIAVESAKQSQRVGVMHIDEPTKLAAAIEQLHFPLVLSTQGTSVSIQSAIQNPKSAILIGPEGGWSDGELATFDRLGLTRVSLTTTILRTETAAVVAAGFAVLLAPGDRT